MNEHRPISVLIVEDDADFQFLIRRSIDCQPDMYSVGFSSTPENALAQAISAKPDIVLMDLSLSGSPSDGIEASRQIRLHTNSKVLLLTSYEDSDTVVLAAVRGLAHGYIFKSQFGFLLEAIRRTAQGPTPQQHMIRSMILSCLSPAERSVFELMLGAEVTLQSSPKTIANQKTMVLKKLDLPSQGALIHVFRTI